MIPRRHIERLRCSGSARPRCVGAHLLSQGPARPLSRRAGGSDGRRLAAVGDQARVRLPDRRAARVRVPPEAVPHPRGPARLRLVGLPRHGRRDAGAGGGGDEESKKGGEYRGLDPTRVEQAVAASTVASLGVAMSDVVVDSLVVERARMTSPPPLQWSALHGAAWTRRGRTSRRPRARCSRSAGLASPRAASPRPTSPARCSRR